MTRPRIYLVRMLVFLALVLALTLFLSGALITAFESNPLLNGLIFFVLLIGIGWNVLQVVRLTPEVIWLESFQQNRGQLMTVPAPRLLAPMASMLSARAAKSRDGAERFTLSAPAMRSLLDSLSSRLDESRELSRYMTGLLIFLGLLGTFWGLLLTVASVSDVIGGMTIGSGDLNALFEQLKSGLGKPLRGMGTAFSSSMFGLAGALVLGFLDLTAGQAQNRFFNELEEWLASLTRLSSGVLGEGGDASVPVYVQALLEQTAENMENLHAILVRGDAGQQQANAAVLALTDRIATLSETMRDSQQMLMRMADSQAQLAPALTRLGERASDDGQRTQLRAIEAVLTRMLTEGEQGRQQSTAELRSDIRVLTRTIAALAEGQPT